MTDAAGGQLELRARLARGTVPLAIALLIVITVSAPTAYYVLSVADARTRAEITAASAAEDIQREAAAEPRLWRYNSGKLLQHIRDYRLHAGVDQIAVMDESGVSVETSEPIDDRRADVWGSAPIRIGESVVGTVWVSSSIGAARRDAVLLALAFAALGSLLAGMMVLFPLRIISRAESELRPRLLALSTRTAALQEAERRAISRDLHDSVGQTLTAIRINLQRIAGRSGAADPDLARETLELCDLALEEIRRAVASLSPAILDDVGLEAAIARMCGDVAERSQIEVRFEPAIVDTNRSPAVDTAAYRIVQEALTNAVKHAGASAVEVRLRTDSAELLIEIADDGAGFDGPDPGAGRGLASMSERAELLGGSLAVTSSQAGTTVAARLPLAAGDAVASDREPR